MKTKLVLIAAVFAALVASAQTNAVIFPQLLSMTNSVLMTNAEFRVISGVKLFFKNSNGYRSFYPGEVNSNVLTALHTSIQQIANDQQKRIDAARRNWDASHPAYQFQNAPEPVDEVFENEKNEMDVAEKDGTLSETTDHITDNINSTFSEIIENAILNGADGTRVGQLERARDLEKLKVVNYALDLAKKSLATAKQAEAVAQSNKDEFDRNPISYLSKSTNSADRKLAKDLSENTNAPSQ